MNDELKNANAMLNEIETMYPDWRKFRDLAEAVRWHTTAQDKVIANLRDDNESLREKLAYFTQRTTSDHWKPGDYEQN